MPVGCGVAVVAYAQGWERVPRIHRIQGPPALAMRCRSCQRGAAWPLAPRQEPAVRIAKVAMDYAPHQHPGWRITRLRLQAASSKPASAPTKLRERRNKVDHCCESVSWGELVPAGVPKRWMRWQHGHHEIFGVVGRRIWPDRHNSFRCSQRAGDGKSELAPGRDGEFHHVAYLAPVPQPGRTNGPRGRP